MVSVYPRFHTMSGLQNLERTQTNPTSARGWLLLKAAAAAAAVVAAVVASIGGQWLPSSGASSLYNGTTL